MQDGNPGLRGPESVAQQSERPMPVRGCTGAISLISGFGIETLSPNLYSTQSLELFTADAFGARGRQLLSGTARRSVRPGQADH